MSNIKKLEAMVEATEHGMDLAFEGDSREAYEESIARHAAATCALSNALQVEAASAKLEAAREDIEGARATRREWLEMMADIYRDALLGQSREP